MAKEMLPKFDPMTNIPATVVFPYGDARVIPRRPRAGRRATSTRSS
jgi:hypothetical protein